MGAPTAGTGTAGTGTAAIRTAYVDTPDGQLHYRYTAPPEGCQCAPCPVLLLHMSASSSQCFEPLMAALASAGYACVAPDMPGFGGSFDPAADPPAIAYYANLYHAAFAATDAFARGYHVIGHHSGGVIGTDLAANHGQPLVRSLTLVGPVVMSAEERQEQATLFLHPFNRPVASGEHLVKTWKLLLWEGIPEDNLALLQREAIDHIRAWRGRSQIYACVWAYDCATSMAKMPKACRVLALCAEDDLLWPFFGNVAASEQVAKGVIKGSNFGPDLDCQGIMAHLLPTLEATRQYGG